MHHYVGLMSGTSLDGVDAALVSFDQNRCAVIDTLYLPYPEGLKLALLKLHEPSCNELEESQLLGIELAQLYGRAVLGLLKGKPEKVCAIGCHGQTVRHRPELRFTLQLNNPSLLAELTRLPVVADFRSRDIAAGGQGAPLVPAFHQAVFGHSLMHRAILNIGGISNLTNLPPEGTVTGFDSGPGNLLMDAWCQRHTGEPFDKNGAWGGRGQVIKHLLDSMLAHPYFRLGPPKSAGRDIFNMAWLESLISTGQSSLDIQATLVELTARSITDSLCKYCNGAQEVYICGGGAHNQALINRLQTLLPELEFSFTEKLGIPADWVEAAAFAWLARQTMEGRPGNLPAVTGASGSRILGTIYPA